MGGRVVLALIVAAIAYGVGWISDAALNDPCVATFAREIDSYDHVQRWFPVRTDCQVTTRDGVSRIEAGSADVFLAMFGLTLVTGTALLSRLAVGIRAAAVLAAGAAAFLVVFIV